jgi:hypothetical protein
MGNSSSSRSKPISKSSGGYEKGLLKSPVRPDRDGEI